MSLALLTLGLLCAPPTHAQGGYPGGGWLVTDNNGYPLEINSTGYPLTGTPTGSAGNTYPADMTAAALDFSVDNRQWLQASSGGPHSYDPNPLGCPYLYGLGPSPLSTRVSLSAVANNFAANNNYYGSFNPSDHPYHTSQFYQDPSLCEPVIGSAGGSVSGTLWALWSWTGTGSPPDHLNILLTTNVQAAKSLNYGSSGLVSGLNATATASDGSPFNEIASTDGVQTVVGRHLLRVPVSNGVARVSLNGNVSASAFNSIPYGAFNSYYTGYYGATNGTTGASSIASVSANAYPDSREVRIVPNIGTTYHKGVAGLPEANLPDSNNTVTDDTVAPAYNNSRLINPYGVAVGSWGASSAYVWSQQCSGSAISAQPDPGTVSGIVGPSGAIPAFVVTYSRQGEFSSPILCSDHLVVRDSVDGATGSADYYVKFHNEYENKIQLTDGPMYGPWTQVSGSFQSGPQGGNFPLPVTGSVSVTVSIAPGGGVATFLAQAYNVTDIGATYSSPPHGAPLPMPPNQYCWIVDQAYFEQITGTVDNYETSGFQNMISWTINKAYHPGNPLVDYNERLVSSDSPPPTN